MRLLLEPYLKQVGGWPDAGNHILAQYDETHVVVYQAYSPSIASCALDKGYFGRDFSFNRMSWIKPNFLWMMHRSNWARSAGQEVVLAIWLKKASFNQILQLAVPSVFAPALYATEAEWKAAGQASPVRYQWDPDYDPLDNRRNRRAIQLGLRGEVLEAYARGGWIEHLEDITPFVHAQRENTTRDRYADLMLPVETVYHEESLYRFNHLQLSLP